MLAGSTSCSGSDAERLTLFAGAAVHTRRYAAPAVQTAIVAGRATSDAMTPCYAPVSFLAATNARTARSMSPSVWAADTCVRMRAVPSGTTG